MNAREQKSLDNPLPAGGVVVSTRPDRGHFHAADFESDDRAAQQAFDRMVSDPALPRTLVLDAPDRPFAFAGPLRVWQSHSRVTSTGGVTVTPAEGYAGPLIETQLDPQRTERGEDGLLTDVVLDHIWLNGLDRSLGVKLQHVQLSTFHNLHVRRTGGPGLWLSDFCIENLFSDLVLSDGCGSAELPALLIEPESNDRPEGLGDIGNITVNSTRLAGIMIHFPTNDCLRIGCGPAEVSAGRRQRKIQFSGCYFHAHPRQTRPLVTIGDALELAFVGTQMLCWSDHPAVQLGTDADRYGAGLTMISHCLFGSRPGSESVGIRVVKVDAEAPCLCAFGNSFGSADRRLKHAVDWGPQPGKKAAWAANAVHVAAEPFVGTAPADADVPPFATAGG
jgi:hypothetical protein